MEQVFISKLNTPCLDGLRLGMPVPEATDPWALWNVATSQGVLLIVGVQESVGDVEGHVLFRPLRTWVPKEYDLWECPEGCYAGKQHVPANSITQAPACPRCGEETRLTVKMRDKKAVA